MSQQPDSPFPHAHGFPRCRGLIRSCPEDFQVEEVAGFDPDGAGEHQLLWVEKRDSNTDWVAGCLARHAGVSRVDVGYAGLKDRHALTRQWFSLHLNGRPEPDWSTLAEPGVRILQQARHGRKLRPGALKGNRFRLRVRQLEGDLQWLEDTLQAIAANGIPNYFGEQRFGGGDGNIESARRLFAGELKRVKRRQRGFYLSAARSMLFNRVLAARVEAGNWNRPLSGERMMLAGTRSSFLAESVDDQLCQRLDEMDIHPSGPLWGRGEPMVGGEVAELERRVLEPERFWCLGLEQYGLKMERRALRMPATDLTWRIEGASLELEFLLPRGCFATALLRECLDYRQSDVAGPLRESST
ncbi:MAG: tRNA pseudouridine(13) synthase TruD [Sedimenticola sp.]|nr:tRNA pseudouridine(13) synthase TruD [Sedimenticola sp.]